MHFQWFYIFYQGAQIVEKQRHLLSLGVPWRVLWCLQSWRRPHRYNSFFQTLVGSNRNRSWLHCFIFNSWLVHLHSKLTRIPWIEDVPHRAIVPPMGSEMSLSHTAESTYFVGLYWKFRFFDPCCQHNNVVYKHHQTFKHLQTKPYKNCYYPLPATQSNMNSKSTTLPLWNHASATVPDWTDILLPRCTASSTVENIQFRTLDASR